MQLQSKLWESRRLPRTKIEAFFFKGSVPLKATPFILTWTLSCWEQISVSNCVSTDWEINMTPKRIYIQKLNAPIFSKSLSKS